MKDLILISCIAFDRSFYGIQIAITYTNGSITFVKRSNNFTLNENYEGFNAPYSKGKWAPNRNKNQV